MKENAVHNLGCPVVSRVTFLEIFFSSTVCIFCTILNDDICQMCKLRLSRTSWFSLVPSLSKTEHRKADI